MGVDGVHLLFLVHVARLDSVQRISFGTCWKQAQEYFTSFCRRGIGIGFGPVYSPPSKSRLDKCDHQKPINLLRRYDVSRLFDPTPNDLRDLRGFNYHPTFAFDLFARSVFRADFDCHRCSGLLLLKLCLHIVFLSSRRLRNIAPDLHHSS